MGLPVWFCLSYVSMNISICERIKGAGDNILSYHLFLSLVFVAMLNTLVEHAVPSRSQVIFHI